MGDTLRLLISSVLVAVSLGLGRQASAAIPRPNSDQVFQEALSKYRIDLLSAPKGPKVGFQAQSSVELTHNGKDAFARVEQGTAAGLPAVRVTAHGSSEIFVMAHAAKVRTWDEARATCRKLSPAGAWDLPLPDDYLLAVITQAVPVKIEVNDAGQPASLYPMWVRVEAEAENSSMFVGKSLVITVADGRGMDLQAVDVSRQAVSELKKGQAELEAVIKQGPADDNLIESLASLKRIITAFQDGYPAYCAAR